MKLELSSWSGTSDIVTLCPLCTAWALAASCPAAFWSVVEREVRFSKVSPRKGARDWTPPIERLPQASHRSTGGRSHLVPSSLSFLVNRSLVSFSVPPSSSRPASRQALATNWGHLLESGLSSIFPMAASSGFGPKAPCDGTGDLHFGSHTVTSFPRGGFAARSTVLTDAIPSKLPVRQGLRRAVNAGGAFSACSPVPTGRPFVTAA